MKFFGAVLWLGILLNMQSFCNMVVDDDNMVDIVVEICKRLVGWRQHNMVVIDNNNSVLELRHGLVVSCRRHVS